MKGKIFQKTVVCGAFAVLLVAFSVSYAKADFNPSNLIGDGDFIKTDKMDTGAIQRFLERQNSYLKSFSEGGRSAAQIIHDAAHGHGDATGTINGIAINAATGTVNPGVILATLQKEQSLISNTSRDDNALRKAMGYGCPDSGGCNSAYAGFTKQVENAAWQFRYSYERAGGRGSDYQVGQGFCFDDWNGTHCGRFDNKATASLYRYTPHVYNGNYNFWNLYFNTYDLETPEFSYAYVSQTGYPTINKGQVQAFRLTIRNTGTTTWTKDVVKLGTSHEHNRISAFTREGGKPSGWIAPNRITFKESRVAPGALATFVFYVRNDNVSPGTYNEYFQPLAENITWMQDNGIRWEIRVN